MSAATETESVTLSMRGKNGGGCVRGSVSDPSLGVGTALCK